MRIQACEACLRRTWLLARLGGYLDHVRQPIETVLALDDDALVALWAGVAARRGCAERPQQEYARFGPGAAAAARQRATAVGLELVCRCEQAYPAALRALAGGPAVLHVAGGYRRLAELLADGSVAIVGTRRPTGYGSEVALGLSRELSASGMTILSGMAVGIDSQAHRGAVLASGRTIAVLPGDAAQPYPRSNRALYRQILREGVAVGELGVGVAVRRWSLLARNRLVAALADLTVVVQGASRSGSLRTAGLAVAYGRPVGAVPGSVLVRQSEGPHGLLRGGALLIRSAQDALDAVCGVGVRQAQAPAAALLRPEQQVLLEAIRAGAETPAEIAQLGGPADAAGALAALAELELIGCIRRVAGGRYVATV
jgi:DNA processing protein